MKTILQSPDNCRDFKFILSPGLRPLSQPSLSKTKAMCYFPLKSQEPVTPWDRLVEEVAAANSKKVALGEVDNRNLMQNTVAGEKLSGSRRSSSPLREASPLRQVPVSVCATRARSQRGRAEMDKAGGCHQGRGRQDGSFVFCFDSVHSSIQVPTCFHTSFCTNDNKSPA